MIISFMFNNIIQNLQNRLITMFESILFYTVYNNTFYNKLFFLHIFE